MAFTNKYTSLIINGALYSKEALLQKGYLEQTTVPTSSTDSIETPKDSWKKSLQIFLSEWLNNQDFVTVTTSGSTGKPKKIQLSKERMVNSALMTGQYFQFKAGQTALLCLPCDYIAGKMMVVRAMVWGLDLHLVPPTGNPVAKITEKIDFAAMIPLQVSSIIEQSPQKFNLIQQLIIGGGKVDYLLQEKLNGISTECFATYGMTETITHVAIKKLNGEKYSPYFEGLPNITFRQDNRGCLTISAPHLSPELVITNDIIDLKNEQQFEWLGRFDNVINTGGIKVFPEKIEAKLEKLIPQRFFISSIPDKKLENKVILLIEDKHWIKKKLNTLNLDLKQVLSKFELPRSIYFIEQFMETPTKKIQRSKTKEAVLRFNL